MSAGGVLYRARAGLAIALLTAGPVAAVAAAPSAPPPPPGFAEVLAGMNAADTVIVARLIVSAPDSAPGQRGPGRYMPASIAIADTAWGHRFVSALMRESRFRPGQSCLPVGSPGDSLTQVGIGARFLHGGSEVRAVLLFGERCAQLSTPGRFAGAIELGDAAGELFALARAALPADTALQRMSLPPARSGGARPTRPAPVETLPVPLVQTAPEYPRQAQRAGITGTVMVQLLVGSDGRVEDARVARSVAGLDEAALAAARRWVFEPAYRDGQPVAVWVTAPVKFTLR